MESGGDEWWMRCGLYRRTENDFRACTITGCGYDQAVNDKAEIILAKDSYGIYSRVLLNHTFTEFNRILLHFTESLL